MPDETGIVEPETGAARSPEDLNQSLESSLIGLPFLFFQPAHGDELIACFGAPAPSTHPMRSLVSSHAIYTRASNWTATDAHGREIASGGAPPALPEGARISEARAIATAAGYRLELRLDDGSLFAVVPDPDPDLEPGEAMPPVNDGVADWEVFTPDGCLWVGPGLQWAFEHGRK